MLRADVLTLVEESPKAHGVLETPQETTRKVYCTMRSIGQSEVYQAKAAGLAPEIKLVLAHAFEYKGEKRCVFRDVPYRIIRTYIKETDEIELTVERIAGNADITPAPEPTPEPTPEPAEPTDPTEEVAEDV